MWWRFDAGWIGVLPIGRNIQDLYRIPSQIAMMRSEQAIDQISANHIKGSNTLTDPYPETIAVTLWGLDTIKTKGESVATLLALV